MKNDLVKLQFCVPHVTHVTFLEILGKQRRKVEGGEGGVTNAPLKKNQSNNTSIKEQIDLRNTKYCTLHFLKFSFLSDERLSAN